MRRGCDVEVDLVDDHCDPALLRDAGELSQLPCGRDDARRVVRRREHDDARTGGEGALDAPGIDPPAVLEAPLEPRHAGAEHRRGGRERVVARLFEQHFIARLDERRERQEVGSGAPDRRRHVPGKDAVSRRDRLDERPVAVGARAREVQRVPGAGQIGERTREQVRSGEVDPRDRSPLRPLHVRGARDGHAPGFSRLRRAKNQ
jgi:hypothetical protein